MEKTKKIASFTDLNVWGAGHQFVLVVYNESRKFPKEELFGLTSQLRRAVVSFTSNIAEGFSRSTYPDKIHFYVMAVGSLTESQNQLLIARDLAYLPKEKFDILAEETVALSKMINGLIKVSKSHLTS